MTKLRIVGLLLLVACSASAPRAQEPAELFSNVERVLGEKEPAWKVERVTPGAESDPARRSIVLRSGEGQAAVDVSVWKKEKDARDVFAAHATAFDNTRGRRMVKDKLPGLGDESYIWTNRGSEAWPMIQFRQGRVNVTVFAPSVAVAKRFARRVLEQLHAE